MPFPDNKRFRVLLVDDAPENLRILSESLRDDYTIMFAKNGPDALRLARRQPPDLILLDVIMPGMDGYEVCRRLKGDAATRDIPIMFITAQNEETDEATGLSLGAGLRHQALPGLAGAQPGGQPAQVQTLPRPP